MRRVATILLLLVISSTLSAQDEWDLTETLELSDDEFSFSYPEGYTLTTVEDGFKLAPGWEPIRDASVMMEVPTPIERAYFMTEFEDDATLAMDADWTTDPEGTVIYLLVSPLEDWQIDDPQQSLYDISMSVCDILGMSTFSRTPMRLMGRLAVTCEGFILTNERSAINLIWLDDGNAYVLGVEVAGMRSMEEDLTDLVALAETFKSTPVAPLDREIALAETGYVMDIPEAWSVMNSGNRIEMREIAHDPAGGMTLVFTLLDEQTMRANDSELETTEDALDFIMSAFDFEDPAFTEVMIGEEITLEISGRIADEDAYARIAPYMLGEDLLAFFQFAPNAESLEKYESTYHAILDSVRLAEELTEDDAKD
jgi:hypothetical protein